jgi:hypothetical protein
MKDIRVIFLLTIFFASYFYCLQVIASSSDGSSVIYIKPSDKLGVGTKSPQAKLDINGNILIKDGSQGDGKILKTDANGLAFWDLVAASANGEWTDTGFLLHSNGSASTKSIVIGGTTLLNADLLFRYDGSVVLNEQASSVNLRIEGETNENLLTSNGAGNTIGIGLIESIEKLNVNGAIALDTLSSSPAFTSDYGKVYVNGSTLFFKDDSGNEYDLTAGDRVAAGSSNMVQFRQGGQFQANGNFIWDSSNGRLGLHNTIPDSVLDDNGAFTYRGVGFTIEKGNSNYGNSDIDFNVINDPGEDKVILNRPGGTNASDLLIALLASETLSFSAPVGWTSITSQSLAGFNIQLFYKIIGSSEPVSYEFDMGSSSDFGHGLIFSFRNASISNPIAGIGIYNGSANIASPDYSYPAIDSLISGTKYKVLRIAMHGDNFWCQNGSALTADNHEILSEVCMHATLPDSFINGIARTETAPIVGYSSDFLCVMPGMCDSSAENYASFSLALNVKEFVPTPDLKSSVMWLRANGDTMVRTDNGGEMKEFTLIDFQADPNEKFLNGMTLSSLDANKLVMTNTDKKFISVDEITVNGSGFIGIHDTNPQALLDLNGSMTFINGVDDMLVRDDLEVDGDIYASNLNITGTVNGNNINGNSIYAVDFFGQNFNGTHFGNGAAITGVNPSAGAAGYIQFNNADIMDASENLFWDDGNGRLGLHNAIPDTVLDVNGAFTYRAECLNPEFEFLSASEGNNTLDSNEVVINKPAGTQQGDLMILVISHDLTGSLATPAGWTSVAQDNYGISHNSNVYYRVADAAEPVSYTFTLDSGVYQAIASIVTYTGVDFTDVGFLASSNTGELPAGAEDYTFSSLSSIPSGYKALRVLTSAGSAGAARTNQIVAGYQYRYDTNDFNGLQEIHFQDKDALATEASVLNQFQCTDLPATCSTETLRYVVYTMAFGLSSASCGPADPDPKSSVLWLKSNGDTMVKTHNGGELKEFTLIDFQQPENSINQDRIFNGLTLTSLDPNKLVMTHSDKKFVSVDEITLNGSGLIGIHDTNPQALLDLNGSMDFINGIDDMLIRDDLEVDGDTYASNLDIATTINGNNISGNIIQATNFIGGTFNGAFIGNGSALIGVNPAAGQAGYIQYNDSGYMDANANLSWDEANGRLGLHNTVPDTILDDNGAFTYRSYCGNVIFENGFTTDYLSTETLFSQEIQADSPVIGTLLIAFLTSNSNGTTFTGNGDWTFIENYNSNTAAGQPEVSGTSFYKIMDETDLVDPSHIYTFEANTPTLGSITILTFKGADPDAPINDLAFIEDSYETNIQAPSVSLDHTGCPHTVLRGALVTQADITSANFNNGHTLLYQTPSTITNTFASKVYLTENETSTSTAAYAYESESNFVSLTMVIEPKTITPNIPDIKSSILYLRSNGDTMVKTHNGGELKEFTLIDFESDPSVYPDKFFNGLTLTSLDPNKLVMTNSDKKFISVDEIIVNGNNTGIGLSSTNEKLTVGGALSFKEGSGPSANAGFGKVYTTNTGLYFKNSAGQEYNISSGTAHGSNSEIQFNNAGTFGANANLSWDASYLASSRLLLDNGNAANPSITFITDADSGIYNNSANNIDFVTAGTEFFSINGSKLSLSASPGSETLNINGTTAFTSSTLTTITAGAGITVTKALMLIQSNGGTVDITANPQIADGSTDGQIVILKGASDTNRVLLEDGDGLSLSEGVSLYLGLNDTITLLYDSDDDLWIELDRSLK